MIKDSIEISTQKLLFCAPKPVEIRQLNETVDTSTLDLYLSELSHLIELPLDPFPTISASLNSPKSKINKISLKSPLPKDPDSKTEFQEVDFVDSVLDRLINLQAYRLPDILRRNGNKCKVDEVLTILKNLKKNQNDISLILQNMGPYDLGGLLKAYICHLNDNKPTQIIPESCREIFIKLTDEVEKISSLESKNLETVSMLDFRRARCVRAFRIIHLLLPNHCSRILRSVVQFGSKCISSQCASSIDKRLTPEALGILLGPCLFKILFSNCPNKKDVEQKSNAVVNDFRRAQILTTFIFNAGPTVFEKPLMNGLK